jgi:2-keto-4-pentenoate hydratase/2-oxohepta-3-ene-1,7-dioic acid hydratase in catechol pathway
VSYAHKNISNSVIDLPIGKVVCVGRNYAEHAKELGNDIPSEPLLFIKPKTALCALEKEIHIPKEKGSVHFETEIAVLLKSALKNSSEDQVADAVWGYGFALDLTLRDLQNELKKEGQPWEKAKAFDGACPVSTFIEKEKLNFEEIKIQAILNGELVQEIKPEQMLWSLYSLIAYMSEYFTLEAGDIILTGTPKGVGELKQGDTFVINLFVGEKRVLETESAVL